MEQKQKLRYSKYLKERKWQYLALLLAYLCVIISQLLIPQQVSKMLSCITAEGVGIGLLTAGMFCLIAVEAAGTYCFGHFNYKLSNELTVVSEQDCLQQMLQISYQKIAGINSAYVGQRMNNDLCYIMDFYVEKIPLLIFQGVKGIAIVVLLFMVSFYVGLFAAAGIGIYVAIYLLTRKRYYQLSEEHRKMHFMLTSVVCGKLSRLLTIKLNSWYKATQRDFQTAGEKFVKASVKYLDFDNFTSNISNVIGRALIPALLLGLYFSSGQNGGAAVILKSSEMTAETGGEEDTEGEDGGLDAQIMAETDPIVVFSASAGTKVIASAEGVVALVEDDSLYGHRITIDHQNGYMSIYRSASEPAVTQGQEVQSGTTLYEMQSPDQKFGYQITQEGTLIDPLDLLEVYG